MIYLYLFGTCFHFIYVFMIIGNKHNISIFHEIFWKKFYFYRQRFFILYNQDYFSKMSGRAIGLFCLTLQHKYLF